MSKVVKIRERFEDAEPEAPEERRIPEALRRADSARMLVILFTDVVGSTALKAELGDRQAHELENKHRDLLLDALGDIEHAQVIRSEGDSYIFAFATAGDAVRFALSARNLHQEARSEGWPLLPEFRVGIHMGEVITEELATPSGGLAKITDIKGLQADTTAKIMNLAKGGQILCSRAVSEDARQSLKGVQGIGKPVWKHHGPYMVKGREDALDIFEVGDEESTLFEKPAGNGKARPLVPEPPIPSSPKVPGKKRKRMFWALMFLVLLSASFFAVRQNAGVIKDIFDRLFPRGPSPEELTVDELKHDVVKIRGIFESRDDYPQANEDVRKDAPLLARRLMNLSEDDMDAEHRMLKYQSALAAFVMAASVETDTKEKRNYAQQGIQCANTLMEMMAAAVKRGSSGKEEDQKLYEWVTSKRRTEFANYLLAICHAIKAQTGDESAVETVRTVLAKIPASYKDRYPLEENKVLKWFMENYPDPSLLASRPSKATPDETRSVSDSPPTAGPSNEESPSEIRSVDLFKGIVPNPKPGTYMALIIGINEYEDERIPDLKNARNDAKAMADMLRERYWFEDLELLLDDAASRKAIHMAMRKLVKHATSGNSVLIYYSGHGKLDDHSKEKKDGWWIPADATLGEPDTYVENSSVRTKISNMKAKHVLLISDSCYAGTLFGQTRALPAIEGRMYREMYEKESRWGMTSGNKHPVSDKGPGEHSVFAGQLLRVLGENTKRNISTQEVFSEIRFVVGNNSEQSPICRPLQFAGDQGGEFVFVLAEETPEEEKPKPPVVVDAE